jgi:hypothetical protein
MAEPEAVTVWQADRRMRIAAYAIMVVLALLSLRVLLAFGWMALLGVFLVSLAVANTWWNLLRPKLTAGPDGVRVVSGRTPVSLPWKEIRRCQPGPDGLTIVCADGREVVSKFPQQRKAAADTPTEADAAAAYLAQRAAWARKPNGPVPVYQAPPAPAAKR